MIPTLCHPKGPSVVKWSNLKDVESNLFQKTIKLQPFLIFQSMFLLNWRKFGKNFLLENVSQNVQLMQYGQIHFFNIQIIVINFYDVFKKLRLKLVFYDKSFRFISILKDFRWNITSQVRHSPYRIKEIINLIIKLDRKLMIFSLH